MKENIHNSINNLCSDAFAHKMIYSRLTGYPVFFLGNRCKIDLQRRASYYYDRTLYEAFVKGTIEDIECTLIDGSVVPLTMLHEAYRITKLHSPFITFGKFVEECVKDKTDIRDLGFTTDEVSKIQKATAEIICIASQLWGEGKLNPSSLEFGKSFSSQAEFGSYIETLNEERSEDYEEDYEEDNNEEITEE